VAENGDDPEEIINRLVTFFKAKVLTQDEDLLGIDDFIRDLEIERSNIRCISTSILTICGFLLPILFGIFYFIVKDSSNLHVKIHPMLIVSLIISIIFLFVSIFFSVQGIRAHKADFFMTKLDKHNYLETRKERERTSSERSIWSLGISVVLVLLTFVGIYICIATMPNGTNATPIMALNETLNTTLNTT
jgi:formate hydrogenlyase subunit 3/multisubunit Na+/H+ antiporter MnhD subunit